MQYRKRYNISNVCNMKRGIILFLTLFLSVSLIWKVEMAQSKGGFKKNIKKKITITKRKKGLKKSRNYQVSTIYGSYHSKPLSYVFKWYNKVYLEDPCTWLLGKDVWYKDGVLIIKPEKNTNPNTRSVILMLENKDTGDKKKVEFVQPPNNDAYKVKIIWSFKTSNWFSINKKIAFEITPKNTFE